MIEKRQALSVTQINLYIKEVIAKDDILSDVLVKGELSNFKAHSSGHMYMSLKDESGVMRAVMFRSAAAKLTFWPQNGMKVIAHGRVAVYERDGQYQLYIDDMQQEGRLNSLSKSLRQKGFLTPLIKSGCPNTPKR